MSKPRDYKPRSRRVDRPKRIVCGENHHMARLTEEIVREMRRLHRDAKTSVAVLALDYSVSFWTVLRAIQKKTWKHVEDVPPPTPPSAD